MIITRSWLQEFIDLSAISNDTLYETFNNIGLEVDTLNKIEIPKKVVVGKILSVEKHPDADKLNVCQIDIGSKVEQIVCGAANVVDAEYVAVATVGSVLPDDFHIKSAELRGVKSDGMVCASSELGLASMGKGIMILDDSIGELEVGRELATYPCIADTIIELELTANRGDCLSVYGVARDLSAALDIDMKKSEKYINSKSKLGIGREVELHSKGDIASDLCYKLAKVETFYPSFLIDLRLAMVGVESEKGLKSLFAYVTYATGVIFRFYAASCFRNDKNKLVINPTSSEKNITQVVGNGTVHSVVSVNQTSNSMQKDSDNMYLFEASYSHPDILVEAVSKTSLKTDELYYKTSRGTNPDLNFGFDFLSILMEKYSDVSCYESSLQLQMQREKVNILVDAKEISSIVGMSIGLGKIVTILKKLGFEINKVADEVVSVVVPLFRHDIKHIQDVAEEIVRIVGINNIEAKPFVFAEKARLNVTTSRYDAKKSFRYRATGVGFYENVSYVFSDKALLEKYDFAVTDDALALANPIAEELNTLRSTILVNLLIAAKRNIGYSKKSIPLFEIGAVFDEKREQSEVISFLFCGQIDGENVSNAGKPKNIDFSSFIQKLGGVIGAFALEPCSYKNGLIHPYQSANIVVDGKVCGFISKLHPTVQESFGLAVTFVAELDFDALLPKHINATPISKFQGVYKDLSLVIDKKLNYFEVAKVLKGLDLPMLKSFYAIDVYEDKSLDAQKSLTIRFLIQSMQKTLEESDIEHVMSSIMETLETECQAKLR